MEVQYRIGVWINIALIALFPLCISILLFFIKGYFIRHLKQFIKLYGPKIKQNVITVLPRTNREEQFLLIEPWQGGGRNVLGGYLVRVVDVFVVKVFAQNHWTMQGGSVC